jgi:hypothetical protein
MLVAVVVARDGLDDGGLREDVELIRQNGEDGEQHDDGEPGPSGRRHGWRAGQRELVLLMMGRHV